MAAGAVESPHFEHRQGAESTGDGRKLLKPHNPPNMAHLLQKATPTNPPQTVLSSRNQVFKHEPMEAIFTNHYCGEQERKTLCSLASTGLCMGTCTHKCAYTPHMHK